MVTVVLPNTRGTSKL